MAVLVKGSSSVSATDWGISADYQSLVTQRVSTTQKVDKKELAKHTGDMGAVAYYNQSTEVSAEGYGISTLALAATLSDPSIPKTAGTFYCKEVTVDFANEDFVKSSIKGVCWEGI